MDQTKTEWYQAIAKQSKAALHLTGKKAVIHLENRNDIPFWESIFSHKYPNDTFEWKSESRTPKASSATGCTACLQYIDFLDKSFLIAIDSDLNYLLKPRSKNKYIIQTYTYSYENHLCWANRLNSYVEQASGGVQNTMFDFNLFLSNYSNIVYPLFLLFLHDQKQQTPHCTATTFFAQFNFANELLVIENNGASILDTLNGRVQTLLTEMQSIYPACDIKTLQQEFRHTGLCNENTYLYWRGHNIYDLVVQIGIKLCKQLLHQEKERLAGDEIAIANLYENNKTFTALLDNHLPAESYPELELIYTDISTIFN